MEKKDFVSYEYMTKTAKVKDVSKITDMYEAFGWEVTNTSNSVVEGATVCFKRDRKLKHKAELTKLQRQAEESYGMIENLNASKNRGASVFAYTYGCLSSLILGGGMSLCMLNASNLPLFIGGIALGVLGIALCSVTYPIYKSIVTKKTRKVLPLIDETEEKLANVLEKGNELLGADIL